MKGGTRTVGFREWNSEEDIWAQVSGSKTRYDKTVYCVASYLGIHIKYYSGDQI